MNRTQQRRSSLRNVTNMTKYHAKALVDYKVLKISLQIFGVFVSYFATGVTFYAIVENESMSIFDAVYFCVVLFLTIGSCMLN
jgi:ABC-type bacteriocin/lantibiotic exporter with double-glycine peptidase domain